MPQPLIEFESSAAREQQRREQQRARKLMLDKVRQQHEAAERERAAALRRGEHSWVLPSVEAALDAQAGVARDKNKKVKKDKKKKKKKKKKEKRESSTSSGSSSEEEWVEKTASGIAPASSRPAGITPATGAGFADVKNSPGAAADKGAPLDKQVDQPGLPGSEREGWMEMTSLFGTYTRTELREREGNSRVLARQKEKNKEPDKPGSHARELNPYYREGGTGLPQDRPDQQAPAASFGPSADWLKRALKRAQEQAEEDNTPLQDIAAKRWGSLENFYKMLRDAEERDRQTKQLPPRREMRRPGELKDRAAPGDRERHREPGDHWGRREGRDLREDREGHNYEDSSSKEVHRHLQNDSTHRHARNSKDEKTERMQICDRSEQQRNNVTTTSTDCPPEERRRRNRRSEFHSTSSSSNNDASSSSSSSSKSGNRSRDHKEKRPRRRSKHKSPKRGSHSRSSSPERQSSRGRQARDRDGSRSHGECSSWERPSRDGTSSSPERQSSRGRQARDRDGSRSHGECSSWERPSRDGTSSSPRRPTPRLLRPPSDDEEGRPATRRSPSSRVECAVWDNARRLPSKQAPSVGGWRKKGSGGGKKDASPRRSPKRRRSSSEETSVSETRRFKSRSPTNGTTQKDTLGNPSVIHSMNDTPVDDTSVAKDTPPAKPAKLYTEHELNQLGAKIVKAELLGNQALADKLKQKLDKARKGSEEAIAAGVGRRDEGGKREEVVLLTTTNARGMTRPVAPQHTESASSSSGHKSRKNKPTVSSVGPDGLRDKYFPDDHEMSLKQMFESEKLGSTADSDALFVRAAARSQRAALDDDYTLDDSFVDRSAVREDRKGQESRDRMKAIMDHQRREQALASCPLCLDSSRQQKHLIVSLGSKSYLSLPCHQSLVEGHCLVVPREHLATSTLLDEDTWQEMKSYRQSLVQYFGSLDQDVLFLECCMKLHHMPHTTLHCIPLPRDMGDLAPIYYKKAIQESESEWNQNKKLVDLSGRDVRRALPKGFPYFAVDFGSSPGYAHVIEDEVLFPQYFGQSVVGGMLDIEPQLWRKPRPEKFDEQRRKVLAFAKQYLPFDPAPHS